ncbi:hypothetical protein VNI00_004748 [Paramarasmius palmivorus]|uniref:F-box domain-containing protein n=1 Tax=Paramarasmius palmivorus TaxID=297713 RepID=A0AAW0DJ02_9AGAR
MHHHVLPTIALGPAFPVHSRDQNLSSNYDMSLNSQFCPHCGTQVTEPDNGILSAIKTEPPPLEAEDLSKTNDSPSVTTRIEYKEKLSALETRLHRLKSHIDQVENTLRPLREEYARLNGYAETYKKILHPIRRLPDVALLGIFHACIDFGRVMQYFQVDDDASWPVEGGAYPFDTLDPRNPPWSLSQVSRSWRALALSSSRLWSYVGIVFPSHLQAYSQQTIAKVHRLMTQVQRAGSHLTVSLTTHLNTCTYDESHPLLVAICSHSARWECLRVNHGHDTPYGLKCISSLVRGNVPRLRRLALEIGNAPNPWLNTDLAIDGFEIAPQLRDLFIVSPAADLADILRIPWQQITHYRGFSCEHPILMTPGERNDFSLIGRMSNLEALFWQHIMPQPWSNPSSLNLPSLHTLSIFQDYSPEFRPFFHSILEWFVCESIRVFRFEGYQETLASLKTFIKRCSGTLQDLWIDIGDLQTTHVVELLECVPNLVSLTIRGVETETLQALGERSGDTPRLVPRLREITFYNEVKVDNATPVLEMIENRIRYSHLKGLRVDERAVNILGDVEQRMEEWTSMGTEVEVFDGIWFFLTPEHH